MLQSSRALPDCSNYSVGVYQDGELHITPLKSILQLRPQFNYLDKGGKGAKDETKNPVEGTNFFHANLLSFPNILVIIRH